MKKIVLLSKDAVAKNYLPTYNNKFWKTPNIDALATKGTVFNRHYTVAASTAMAFYSMITGENCYQTECQDYGDERAFLGDTIFEKFRKEGYHNYLIWDETYTSFARNHLQIIEGKADIISLDIIPKIAPHVKGVFDDLTFDDEATEAALCQIYDTFEMLATVDENAFIWVHLPHVLKGRNAYSSDIDVFDKIVGFARELFGDESLFISTDHGNMDGKNHKFSYGFDLEETAICIPLISPKIGDLKEINYLTSNLHLYEILNLRPIKEKLVVSDTAYYCQPKRKIAIINDGFKLIYTKERKYFELYDLQWDPDEKYNLYYPEFYDEDRLTWYSLNQRFFYPYWDKAFEQKKHLKKYFDKIWRKGSWATEEKNKIKFKLKYLYLMLTKKKRLSNIKNIGK